MCRVFNRVKKMALTTVRVFCCNGLHYLNRNVTALINMDKLFHLRSYLRVLTPAQRRSWFEQRKRLTPRVPIGTAVLPRSVHRSFAYIKLA